MRCHTFESNELLAGLPVLRHRFFRGNRPTVGPCKHNPPTHNEGRVYSANPKHIVPHNGNTPFWVLEAVNMKMTLRGGRLAVLGASRGHLVLICGATEIQDTQEESGYNSYVEMVAEENNDDGTKDALLAIRGGIFKVVQQGKAYYLKCNYSRGTLTRMTENAYRKLLQRDAEKAAAERKKQEEWETEQKRWTKKSEEVTAQGVAVKFRHHSGVSLYRGHYRPTDTYVEVVVLGDTEKPARTITVDKAIRTQAGWEKFSDRRFAALHQSCPSTFTLHGVRKFEERDTGERRDVTTWYDLDSTELAAWIAKARVMANGDHS